MTFQAYIDNVTKKTGKTPDDFRALMEKKKLQQYGEVVAWLKKDFALGHGHANAIATLLLNADKRNASSETKIDTLFAGPKAVWRAPYEKLAGKVSKFGGDVSLVPNRTYINLKRAGAKFGLVQVSAGRLDIGLKLKGVAATKRFESAGSWNAMVTHRVRIEEPRGLDAELITWLRRAYDAN